MIVGNPIIMILKAILNWFRLRRNYIANSVDKIPPEIKDALVAWYSPCKQKLTNYDVIEAYMEDFTTWTKNGNVSSAVTINNSTIIINGSIKSASVFKKSNTSMQSINIIASGVKNGDNIEYRYVKNGVLQYIPIVNGINKLPTSELTENPDFNIGIILNINSTGVINLKQLPTSIIKDFSGNKHDAYLYDFKGKLNSGVGIYAQDFKNWNYGGAINSNISTKSYNKFHIVKKKADNWFGFTIGVPKTNYYNQSYKLKFNINKKIDDIKFSIVSTDGNLITTAAYSVYINDGNIIDVPIISEEVFNNKEETNIYYNFGTSKDIEIDVELIADYPNQLCYDGKSYAVAYGLPILTDYTVIADRTWFIDKIKSWSYFIDKSKAFIFERTSNGNSFSTKSFAAETSIKLEETNISYQTKTSYNSNAINHHNDQYDNDDKLIIGSTKDILGNQCFIGCHSDILLFNRTLTDDELDLVKEHFFGIVRIKDALLTVDGKPIITTDNKYIKVK